MAQKPTCIDCGTIYDVRRWQLGYNICLDCGQTHAEQKRQECVSHQSRTSKGQLLSHVNPTY